MAEEPSFMDPSPFANFPQFEPFDHSFNFPDGELPLPDGITPDLDLDDIYLDFSVDDLLLPSYDENDNAGSGSNSNTNSNLTTNSNSNSGSNPGSPESGNSSAASGVLVVHQETKQEESNSRLKRKLDDDDRVVDPNASPSVNPGPNSNFNPSPGSLKIRRSEEVSSPSTFSGATVEDEKRKARLMRNRESAQLSRQRKKHYVEELEEKVKFMNSTIADLNGKISFYMAENVRLHQQLNGNGGNGNANGGGNGNPAPAAVYPQPLPTYHFPWIPYPWHAMRPNGPAVPCIPIPRLKSTQPASAPRAKKSNSKKSESKTKKVASVSLVGLLFIVMVFGGVINFGLGGSGDMVYSGVGGGNGRIFSVKGRGGGLNGSHEFGQFSGRIGSGSHNHGGNKRYEKGRESPTAKHNSSESLPALLYVPRNGKHVEINGNLIIHSVLASERATAHAKSKEQGKQLLGKEGTGLTIPAHVASALAVPKGARDMERHSKACRNSPEHPRALASDSHDAYRDNIKSTVPDGPLEWFHEGLSGPLLSSGTCTEVFQFEVSPPAVDSSGIIPATVVVNATDELPPSKIKNRRILYGQAIPLNGSTLNKTEPFTKPAESSNTFHDNKSVPSMVVSVMADPREAGDGDGDGMVTPKSLSRIFVVVLMDSVKYVTYSCVLPLKSHGPHLVN